MAQFTLAPPFGALLGVSSSVGAQGVNIDCSSVTGAMTYYSNHRDQFGPNSPPPVNPYRPHLPMATEPLTTGSVAVSPDQARIAACAERFRSYDPATNTYRGTDEWRRVCPY